MSSIAPTNVPHAGKNRRFEYYTVTEGSEVGVFVDWLIAAPLVVGWPGAQMKGFHDLVRASAAYHRAMDSRVDLPSEHPLSLVFHFANPAAGSPETHHAAPASAPTPVIPPAASASLAPSSSAPTPVAPPTASPSWAPSSSAPTSAHAPAKAKSPSEAQLETLANVLRDVDIEDLLAIARGRHRDDGGPEESSIMKLSLLVNPNPNPPSDEPPCRVIVQHNVPDEPDVLTALDAANARRSRTAASDGKGKARGATPATPSISVSSLTDISSVSDSGSIAGPSPAFKFPKVDSGLAGISDSHRPHALAPGGSWSGVRSAGSEEDGARTPTSSVGTAEGSFVDAGGSYLQAHISAAAVNAAEDGDAWYAVAAGFETGVFRGPMVNIRNLVNGYDHASFRGFRTHAAALAWYIMRTTSE
ncbi:hypothetical protein FA95DRAFT_1612797 [Auriscalpium vulgare]|uniref:Uncharacterized protein n=1 Tax=Auriscalpium vulgare TaxID=40419 RepID=A0ACB8R5V9_9AGAM|nr:hypothetical protein FA95DRAFT_1612797 [Auriscalpium vulgare]